MEHSAENTPNQRSPTSFYSNLKTQIKINPRNSRLKKQYSNNVGDLKTYESILIQELENNFKRVVGNEEDEVKLDSGSSFFLFALKDKHFCDVIPDVELRKYKNVCTDMIYKISYCHEGHFGLARLLIHEGLYEEAEQHLNIALTEEKNSTLYQTWLAVLKSISTDTKSKAQQSQKYIECKVQIGLVKRNPRSIELLWCLLHISLQDHLKVGEEIENPQHYASKIKSIDQFYGYLAWSEVLAASTTPGHKEKSILLLKQLTLNYPSRPEGYLKLWYYFYSINDYPNALETAESGFLNINETSGEYQVIINLNYAKSLFKLGRHRKCFELLQTLYRKNSHYAVYLYHYGRMCVKSKDSCFTGSAIGALEECLKICSEFRHPYIYYWLMTGYLSGGDKVKANQCAKIGSGLLNSELHKINTLTNKTQTKKLLLKVNSMKNVIKDLHMDILHIEMLEKILENYQPALQEEAKILCRNICKFDQIEGMILLAKLQRISGEEEKSLQTLFSILNLNSLQMKHFFILCEALKDLSRHEEILSICKEMMKKCKSPLVPVQVWISTHMIYVRSLVKVNEFEKAILVLKSLAQVHPPPFIPDVDYLKQLQFATSLFQLEHTVERLSRGSQIDDSELRATILLRAKLLNSKKNLSSLVIESEASDASPLLSDSHSDSEEIGCRTPEPLPRARLSKIPLGDAANNGFAVSMNYKFLYLIGKISAKYQVCIDDGFNAIHDFLNIHHYWMREGIEEDEKMQVKAQFWQGVILYLKKDYENAVSLFKEILSMLFQLNLEKMTSKTLVLLKEYQTMKESNNLN
jgi:tetratricopeptide (TPR) repeat protein